MEIPSKWVRKALYEVISEEYPCYDMQVTGNDNPSEYVIISTQNEEEERPTKCGERFISYTLLDLVTIFNGAGNVGSRLSNDDMKIAVRELIEGLEVQGYNVLNSRYEYPPTINTTTTTQSVFRSFIRVILTLE
jgi:hypothetical protein